MSYLPFISDDDFIKHISKVIETGKLKNKSSEEPFHKNVVDPFGAVFESAVNALSFETWRKAEMMRQSQKTLQNAIGDFHNDILGSIEGWTKLEKGNEIDLIKDDLSIIAEVKNKYNTVTGSKLIDHYNEFNNLIHNKSSKYQGATAYLVQIIPKNNKPMNKCFTPSDKSKSKQKPKDESIRVIDGRSFYELVTGIKDAIDQLHQKIPVVITDLKLAQYQFSDADLGEINSLFRKAYLGE